MNQQKIIEEEKEEFHNALQDTIDSIQNRDIKVVMGDANAKVGNSNSNTEILNKQGYNKQVIL